MTDEQTASAAGVVNEVYAVCARLKAAGFPQDGAAHTGGAGFDHPACPNSDECLAFARERWPGGDVSLQGLWRFQVRWECTKYDAPDYAAVIEIGGATYKQLHPTDPAQACRLALAAALEAERTPSTEAQL